MAKKSKSFLPKRIAGVKVPKSVRQGRLGELLASPRGQAIIAEAIVAAGAVAGAKKAADNPEARATLTDAADKVKFVGDNATDKVSGASSALAYALGEAARSFTDALRRHEGLGDDEPRGADGAESKKNGASAYQAGPL